MLVVADTGPLHYLLLIDQIDLLPGLFGGVTIPTRVRAELLHPKAPTPVWRWAATMADGGIGGRAGRSGPWQAR